MVLGTGLLEPGSLEEAAAGELGRAQQVWWHSACPLAHCPAGSSVPRLSPNPCLFPWPGLSPCCGETAFVVARNRAGRAGIRVRVAGVW